MPTKTAPKTKPYEIRDLKNGDAFRVARVAAKVMDDIRIYNAMATGNYEITAMAVIGALMEKAPDELEEFLAELVGMKVKDFNELPPGAAMDIVADLMERDDFKPFLDSSTRLVSVAKKAFGS